MKLVHWPSAALALPVTGHVLPLDFESFIFCYSTLELYRLSQQSVMLLSSGFCVSRLLKLVRFFCSHEKGVGFLKHVVCAFRVVLCVPLKLFVCRFVPVQNPDDDGHLSAAAFATAFILSLPCWTKRNSPPVKGQFTKTSYQGRHGRPHTWANGVS